MNMTKIYWVIGILLVMGPIGCSVESGTIVVPDVEDEFYIELRETFSNNERGLQWRLRTIESVGCEDAVINYAFRRQPDQELSLTINDIFAPSDCVPAEAPATAMVDVGPLEQGTYTLALALRETVNRTGQLIVGSDLISIEVEEGGGIIPLRKTLRRIPDGSVWGYVNYKGADHMKPVATEFIEGLQGLTIVQWLPDGHYGYFNSTDGGSNITFPGTEAPVNEVLTFQRQLEPEEKTALVDLIQDYRQTYQDSLELSVFNTAGEEW